jgi:Domain of unknown function (DUF4266)
MAATAPRLRCSSLAARVCAMAALLLVAGCAHPPRALVQPWQREHLAKRAMRFDADPLEMRFRQHMFGAREGSDLGYGQPGGGCGCN